MDFISLKNPALLARFKPANLGFSGKHNNHYTTKNDLPSVSLLFGHSPD
jgi:hypothetical protein